MSKQDQRGVEYRVECFRVDLEVCETFGFDSVLVF